MTDPKNQPTITPDMMVAALLKDFPDLEEVLMDLAPAFKKLQTPALRATVTRTTSLHQMAQGTNVTLGEMINRLRVAAGQEEPMSDTQTDAAAGTPSWVTDCEVELFDARETIEAGNHPLPEALAAVNKLTPGQAYAIVTPFLPTPMIEKIGAMGFQTWTDPKGPAHFVTYFSRA
jgi:Domain of unknown function (DUF1858)